MATDEEGAMKITVMIVSLLVFATLCVAFSCYRICLEDYKRKKDQNLSPIETEPSHHYVVHQTPQTTDVATTQESDYQLIFGAVPSNTPTTASLTASTTQEIVRLSQRPLTELQNEYERRAQERRQNLERNTTSISEAADIYELPPYSTKDNTLPSYDQAVSIQAKE